MDIMATMNQIRRYLDAPKEFVPNAKRLQDVMRAVNVAGEVFNDGIEITIKPDPLQTGALILRIKGYDIGVDEVDAFIEIIDRCDNFEISSSDEPEKVEINIIFDGSFELYK